MTRTHGAIDSALEKGWEEVSRKILSRMRSRQRLELLSQSICARPKIKTNGETEREGAKIIPLITIRICTHSGTNVWMFKKRLSHSKYTFYKSSVRA